MSDLRLAAGCVCLLVSCFSEPGDVDTSSTASGSVDGTAGSEGPPDTTTTTTTTQTSTATTAGVTSTTQTSGSETGGTTQCPECATGFCTEDGTCAWAVFVTSQRFSANLGGLTGADMWCNNLADAADLPGDYMAWMSSTTVYAANRLVGHAEPYVLVDGTLVADSFSVFTTLLDIDDIYLEHAIDLTEQGEDPDRGTACQGLPAGVPVWTGTFMDGTWDTYATCNEWTSDAPLDGQEVFVANARAVDSFWTIWCSDADCDQTASLYCFQVSED